MKSRVDLSSIDFPANQDVFAEILVSVRGAYPVSYRSHLSDAALTELIKLSFHGSLQVEEGRYPAFRFFSYTKANKDNQLRTVAVFKDAIELDLAAMRRLVHLAPADRHALVVEEQGPRLMVTRIMSIDSTREINNHLGRPEFWTSYQTPMGSMITVEGPGEMRVTEATITLKLRGGHIEEAVSVSFVPGVNDWFHATDSDLLERAERRHSKAKSFFGGSMNMLIGSVWSQVLSTCVSQRHGGAFVVINPNDLNNNVNLNYELEGVDLGEEIVDFWVSCIKTNYTIKRDLDRWLRRQNAFRKHVDVVSSLANVDGCVCVTPGLKILGCGGEIIVDEATAMKSPIVLIDAKTNKRQELQDSNQFGGTRHRSAYRLCKTVPDSLAFVVSQDGDLSVFYSNDEYVYAFTSLGPWYTNADLE